MPTVTLNVSSPTVTNANPLDPSSSAGTLATRWSDGSDASYTKTWVSWDGGPSAYQDRATGTIDTLVLPFSATVTDITLNYRAAGTNGSPMRISPELQTSAGVLYMDFVDVGGFALTVAGSATNYTHSVSADDLATGSGLSLSSIATLLAGGGAKLMFDRLSNDGDPTYDYALTVYEASIVVTYTVDVSFIGQNCAPSGTASSVPLPVGTQLGDIIMVAVHAGAGFGTHTASITDPRMVSTRTATIYFGSSWPELHTTGWGYATDLTDVTVDSSSLDGNCQACVYVYRAAGTVTEAYSSGFPNSSPAVNPCVPILGDGTNVLTAITVSTGGGGTFTDTSVWTRDNAGSHTASYHANHPADGSLHVTLSGSDFNLWSALSLGITAPLVDHVLTPFCEDFENGISGDIVSTANTDFFQVTGSAILSETGVGGSQDATGGFGTFWVYDPANVYSYDEDVVSKIRFKIEDDGTASPGEYIFFTHETSRLSGTEEFETGPELRYGTSGEYGADNFAVWNAAPGSGGVRTQVATFTGPLGQWCTAKMTWHTATSTWDMVVKNEAGTIIYSALAQAGMANHHYLNTIVFTADVAAPNISIDNVGVNCPGFNNAHCGTKVARYTVTTNTGLPYTVSPKGPNNAIHHGAFAVGPLGLVSFMASLSSDNSQDFYVRPMARYLAWNGTSFSTISLANFSTLVHMTGNAAWTTVTDQLTAPAGATHWALDFSVSSDSSGTPPTIGTVLYLDCVFVVEDGRDLSTEPYLDGDQANTVRGDGIWEGTPEDATSIWGTGTTGGGNNPPPTDGGGGGGGSTDPPPPGGGDTPPPAPEIPPVLVEPTADYATDLVTRHHPGRTFCLDADIQLGDHLFNTVDQYGTLWLINDIDGWWNLPDPDIPDITRGIDDGSYETRGRYSARVFTITGSFWPAHPSDTRFSRDLLVRAINLCHYGAWFATHEADATRASKVWLSGRPSIATVGDNGRTDFTIGLKAPDPVKYGLFGGVLPGWNQVSLSSSSTTVDFGRVYDRVYDWSYPDVPGGGVLADTATVVNSGNVRVSPTITVYGPTLGPIDIHNTSTSQTMRVRTALTADEVLVIDCLNRTVTLNGTPNKRLYLDTVTDWIYLDPGTNKFNYTEETGSSNSFITVQWRSGWIG